MFSHPPTDRLDRSSVSCARGGFVERAWPRGVHKLKQREGGERSVREQQKRGRSVALARRQSTRPSFRPRFRAILSRRSVTSPARGRRPLRFVSESR
ncbi:hypothetical protein AAFF_G00207170 [Aldrovandia affinis]|uniref:Uncharacterized protein n=1 Tax=Aldrovandia affinis TaxID=143900 RepID=A0AAD7RHA1_9TELE|nr:hypothetical protein AAFF_G00207170 [Aldrovandia affinis]